MKPIVFAGAALASALLASPVSAQTATTSPTAVEVTIRADQPGPVINPNIYFESTQLSRCSLPFFPSKNNRNQLSNTFNDGLRHGTSRISTCHANDAMSRLLKDFDYLIEGLWIGCICVIVINGYDHVA